jgi:hypothetical protein
METKERVNKTITIVGGTGTGKTTYLLSRIKPMLASGTFDKVIIFDEDEHDSYKQYPVVNYKYLPALKRGIVRSFINDETLEDAMYIVNTFVRNSIIVLEDAGRYLMEKLPQNTKRVFVNKKKKNLDIFVMYHGCSEPPPKLYILSDIITLHKTMDTPDSMKGKIPNYPLFKKYFEEVQSAESEYYHKEFSLK